MPSDSIIRDLELIIVDKKKELEEVEKAISILENVGHKDINNDMLIDSINIVLITLEEARQLIEAEAAEASNINMNTLIGMYHKKQSEARSLELAIKLIEKSNNSNDNNADQNCKWCYEYNSSYIDNEIITFNSNSNMQTKIEKYLALFILTYKLL